MQQNLYVHLDGISNSVLSKGMDHNDFNRYTTNRPKNVLLLDQNERDGEYEPHTGFRIIRGQSNVDNYFKQLEKHPKRNVKWLDFEEYDSLKRLTANEIAEILYLAHMKTQLRSPFFYKLQNNYAFFEMKEQTIKVFYRHSDDFYGLLSQKITNKVLYQINSGMSFFTKKKTDISILPVEIVSDLKGIMQEGSVFDFSQIKLKNNQYVIPIHVIEDNLRKVKGGQWQQDDHVATITYCNSEDEWQLVKETSPLQVGFT